MPIQDTTPYGSYQSLLGGNQPVGGMGAGINAASGSMAQTLADRGTQNQALNVTQQDIANQTAQQALDVARLKMPQTAAEQALAMQGIGQDLSIGSKYGMPSKEAAMQAKIEASFEAASTSRKNELVNEGAVWKAANAAAEDAGPKAMANPGHPVHKVINGILTKGGVTGLPDDFTAQGSFLAQHAAAATATVDYAQKIGAIRATGEETANQKYIEGEYAVQAQLAGAGGRFYQQLFSMEPARRTIALVQGEIAKQIEPDGTNYYTSAQKAQFEAQAMQALQSSGQLERAANFGEDRAQIVRQGSDEVIKAEAKRFGIPIDGSKSIADQRPSIAADVKKAAADKQIKDFLDHQFASTFPGAKLDDSKPAVNLLSPGTNPVAPTVPSPFRQAGAAVATPMAQPAATPPPTLSGRAASGQIGSIAPGMEAPKTVVRKGTTKDGKRVVQYSDGTIGPE